MGRLYFWDNISWLNRYLIKQEARSLADCLGWPAQSVTNLESGTAPTIHELTAIQDQFGWSFQELLEKDLSQVAVSSWIGHFQKRLSEKENIGIYSFFEIPLNREKAGASGIATVKPINQDSRHLAKICVPASIFPNMDPQDLCAFEIEGYSMYPLVRSGDIIIAHKVAGMKDFMEGRPYILKLKDGSLYFKRLFKIRNESDQIQLSSDNPDYPQILIEKQQIEEYWLLVKKLGE